MSAVARELAQHGRERAALRSERATVGVGAEPETGRRREARRDGAQRAVRLDRVGDDLGAHLLGEAEAPVVLHRARLGGIGLGVERGRGLGVHQQGGHSSGAQFVGQHQATGATAHDEHLGFYQSGRRVHGVNLESVGRQRSVSSPLESPQA